MALFGAPIAHEDHAQRACYAALHLQRELAAYAAELRREQGLSFSVRIGLNSGEVVVGAIGDDLAHGLHGDRPHGRPRAADGAARRARQGLPHRAHGGAGGGLLRARRPRRVRGQGREPAAARLRADRRRRRPRAARRLTRARLLALRRPRRRAAGARERSEQALAGQAAGDRHRRRGRASARAASATSSPSACRAKGMPVYHVAGPGARQVGPAACPCSQLLRAYFDDHRAGLRPDGARADRRQAAAPRRGLRRRPAAAVRLPRRARPRAPRRRAWTRRRASASCSA